MAKAILSSVKTRRTSGKIGYIIRFVNTDESMWVEFVIGRNLNYFKQIPLKVLNSKTVLLDKNSIYKKHGNKIDDYRQQFYQVATYQLAKFLVATGVSKSIVNRVLRENCIPRTA